MASASVTVDGSYQVAGMHQAAGGVMASASATVDGSYQVAGMHQAAGGDGNGGE